MSAPANRGAAPENKEGTHLICIRFRVLHPFNGNTRERKNRAQKTSFDRGRMCAPESVTCDQGGSHVTLFSHTCDSLK